MANSLPIISTFINIIILGGVIFISVKKIQKFKAEKQVLDDTLKQYELELSQNKFLLQHKDNEIELIKKSAENYKAQLAEMENRMELKFENLTNRIMEESITKIENHSSKNIGSVLEPLKERIVMFQSKIETLYTEEAKERHSLKNEIKSISEIGNQLNQDALNLTKALKGDVKAQGNWGEMVLEKILENSGLRKGEEYLPQAQGMGLKNDEGSSLRPDIVVLLPEEKHIIIDSKVSLTHYERFIGTDSNEEKATHLKLFNDSIESHVRDLSKKSYHQLDKLQSPDFVLMFFPIEGAYSLAIQQNPDLFYRAWDQSIIIVGPTTLMATLKTIHSIWRQEKSNKNALEIASESGKMYDKMANFLSDLTKLGDQLKRTEDTYHSSLSKLKTGKGNIISRLEHIKGLGAKAKKQIEMTSDEQAFIE